MNASACIAALRQVRKTIDRLGQLPRALARAAAPDISLALVSQFQRGVDPYGAPWAPLKPTTGHGPPPLTDTRALRDGTRAIAKTAGISIVLGRSYGAFAQTGFRVGKTRVKPRPILPNRGMPRAWRVILDRTARALAERARRA